MEIKDKILRLALITVSSTILIFLILANIYYNNSINKRNELQIKQTLSLIDREFKKEIEQIEKNTLVLFKNKNTKLSISNFNPKTSVGIKDLMETLNNIKKTNLLIESLYFYFPDDNSIVSSENGFYQTDNFKDRILENINLEKPNSSVGLSNMRTINSYIGETYVSSLIYSSNFDNKYVICIVNINSAKLSSLSQNIINYYDKYILLNENDVVYASSDLQLLGKTKSNIKFDSGASYVVNSQFDKFSSIIIFDKLPITKQFFQFFILSLIFSLIFYIPSKKIIIYFCNKITVPYNQIIDKASISFQKEFLQQLLYDNNLTEKDLHYKLQTYKIQFSYDNFYLVFFEIYESESEVFNLKTDMNLSMFSVANIIIDFLNEDTKSIYTNVDNNKMCFVLSTFDSLYFIEFTFKLIAEQIYKLLKIKVEFFISDTYNNLTETSIKFYSAKKYFEYFLFQRNSVVLENSFLEMENDENFLKNKDIDFDLVKDKLINEDVASAITLLNESIYNNTNVSIYQLYSFLFSFISYLENILNSFGWNIDEVLKENKNIYSHILTIKSPLQLNIFLFKILTQSQMCLKNPKTTKNKDIIDKIKSFVESNYEKDISLTTVSNSVFISPTYLSKIFKAETGINFIEFITIIRINKAKELLMNPKYKIVDVAEATNLGSMNSFIRTFKKMEGITPGQFRNIHSKNILKGEKNNEED